MKKITSVLFALVLLFTLASPALAAETSADALPYIIDAAMLLTDEERDTLESEAEQIAQQYQCGVYIIIVDDFTEYAAADDAYDAAKILYTENSLGYGAEKSGITLLLSLNDRDFGLIAFGYGNTAVTDYGRDKLKAVFLDNFGKDDWYGGFSDYLSKSADMLEAARAGNPVDVGSNPLKGLLGIAISIALGCLLAFLICGFLEAKMKSVANKTEANAYIKAGSVNITARDDVFTHTTQVREKIETQSRSRGGGTTIDSDGFSGTSGKF